MPDKFTIILGGPSSGFSLNGLFDFAPEAIEYAVEEFTKETWWVAPINSLEDEESENDRISRMASALAIAEGYNPNDVPVAEWAEIKNRYEAKAKKVLDTLAAETEITEESDPLEQPDEDELDDDRR